MMAGFPSTHMSFILRLGERQDPLTWREFHERYGELLIRYARRRGASPQDAEDAVQEVEMYLFKALCGSTYDAGKGRFRAYLRASVAHALARRAARQARQPAVLDPNDFDYLAAASDADADAQWEQEWRMHRLRGALRRVSPEFESRTLEMFNLHVLEGRAAKECAQAFGVSPDAIYKAKLRVLKRVREQFEAMDPDEDL